MSQPCPCGSGEVFEKCCQPFLLNAQIAPTPSALMRSRYSAYAMQNADYLIATWHADCQPERWRESLEEGFKNTHWLGLNVIDAQPGKQADEGYVEFAARFKEPDKEEIHLVHERSRFLRVNERWYYIDGIKPQPGRNDSCPCGSGKKYKKCCGR
ncbi:MAG: YchJ family protein [Ewingella sp.]|nr:YchJ family protein [Ewingella sp.]